MLRSILLAVTVAAVEETCEEGQCSADADGVSLLQLRRKDALHARFAELTAELHTAFPMVQSYGMEEEAPAEPTERMEADEVAMTDEERMQHEENFVRLCSQLPAGEDCTTSHATALELFDGSVPVVNAAEISHGEARGYQAGYQEDPIFQQVSKLEFERDYHGLVVPDEVQALLEEEYELNASETMELQLLEMSLPERFDPREKWPQCRDVFERVYQQGACGSCWAFAFAHAHDSRMCIQTGDKTAISREDVKACAPPNDRDGCSGGWMGWAWTKSAKEGFYKDNCWQYKAKPRQYCRNKPKSCTNTFKVDRRGTCTNSYNQDRRCRGYSTNSQGLLKMPNEVAKAKAELMRGGPMSFMSCTSGFGRYRGGILTCPSNCPQNHAMTLLGWGKENGKEYWLFTNSWGTGWGERGMGRMQINKPGTPAGQHCKETNLEAWDFNPATYKVGGDGRVAPAPAPRPTPPVTPRPTPAPPTPSPTPPPSGGDGSMNVLASSVCVYTEDGDKQVRCCAGDQPTEAPYVHVCRDIATMEGVAHTKLRDQCKGLMAHTVDITHVWTSAPCA